MSVGEEADETEDRIDGDEREGLRNVTGFVSEDGEAGVAWRTADEETEG